MVDFLIQSITKSSKNGDDFLKKLCPDGYYKAYKQFQILAKLNDPKTRLLVVNMKQEIQEIKDLAKHENSIIFAFIIFREDVLYYAYTKRSLRRKKYFLNMLKQANLIKDNKLKVSSMTKAMVHWSRHIKINLEYLPSI